MSEILNSTHPVHTRRKLIKQIQSYLGSKLAAEEAELGTELLEHVLNEIECGGTVDLYNTVIPTSTERVLEEDILALDTVYNKESL